MNPKTTNTYHDLLHAEFFDESYSSLCEESDMLHLWLSSLDNEGQEANLFLEFEVLTESNERADRALMKVDNMHESSFLNKDRFPANGSTATGQGRPKLSDENPHKVLIGVGSEQRRRSVCGTAAWVSYLPVFLHTI